MSSNTNSDEARAFALIAIDCSIWWMQQHGAKGVEWKERDMKVTRIDKRKGVFGRTVGHIEIEAAPGKRSRLYFDITAERVPFNDIIAYPPCGFVIDKRSDQRYWLGEKKVEIKKLSPQAIKETYDKHYA